MRLAQTMTDMLTNKMHAEKQMCCAPADTKLTRYATRLHRVKEELLLYTHMKDDQEDGNSGTGQQQRPQQPGDCLANQATSNQAR